MGTKREGHSSVFQGWRGRSRPLNTCKAEAERCVSRAAFPPSPCVSGESWAPKHPQLLYLLAVAVVIILFILLLGVIMAKRKRKHGSLWLPEGFTLRRDSSNHKRREPVGQDAVGLK